MTDVKTKRCPKCGIEKPLEMFSRNSTRKDGWDCYCKECVAKKVKQCRERIKLQNKSKNLDEIKESDATKLCIKCKEVKPMGMFKINRNHKDGFSNICKVCASKLYKENIDSMTDERIGEIEIMKPTKKCVDCGQVKLIIEFPVDRSNYDGHRSVCVDCYTKRNQQYYDNRLEYCVDYRNKHQSEYSTYHRERGLQLKTEVLTHYGNGKCECVICGENRLPCLSIDHINGGGAKHRRIIGSGGVKYYKWLKENNFPDGYQTLCMNDQFIKEFERK